MRRVAVGARAERVCVLRFLEGRYCGILSKLAEGLLLAGAEKAAGIEQEAVSGQ